ncbi:DNA ligase [Vibrio ezurae]|uniref:DNA ligase n=1 Tax=Vibrio ezurae TaxID=252583 RepID=UPI00041B2E2C|nr:DNA ligase [Vibrio ezurae]
MATVNHSNGVSLMMLSCASIPFYSAGAESLMLAQTYQGQALTQDHLVSEKLDGIRAIWDGATLTTRNGTQIAAPDSFLSQLPFFAVEGELWAGRGGFSVVQQTVLDTTPNHLAWSHITFVLFDKPDALTSYSQRYATLLHWKSVHRHSSTQVVIAQQREFRSYQSLGSELKKVVKLGGEGLMVRNKHAVYIAGRSEAIYKIKLNQDAEARVIGYKQGKGKYQHLVGALHVESPQGVRFYIGSGLSDEHRRNPPKIGTLITYRYNDKTDNGVPKFARFMRERSEL